eukprot:TRINITY_DN12109_c0_g1_i1.p1 TRINITY_DN12109_c0_g1~~TRINITY_DN12109_c0_g1_i1.p1  ORF type:complete len:446 (-),score=61.61 TRINITY_DN12109_c0_g1_i1:1386-2693(-)
MVNTARSTILKKPAHFSQHIRSRKHLSQQTCRKCQLNGKESHLAQQFQFGDTERESIRESWDALMRWSRVFKTRKVYHENALNRAQKVAVLGGGSFGTAIATVLARNKLSMEVVIAMRDEKLCQDINQRHINTKYFSEFCLPPNITAVVDASLALQDCQYIFHAVPVQHSRKFLGSVSQHIPPDLPIISVSKGLEVTTGQMMSQLIPSALGRRYHPTAFISGPSFAYEVMQQRPTAVVCASTDSSLALETQQLLASNSLRVNTSSDVIGVEICGALKNVLAIAAGIVDGLDLGRNALAALVSQGCTEIRWLAEKMGAHSSTISGLSGMGDIMLTCYGDLSRNRKVGLGLGRGLSVAEIMSQSTQIAEGVATAGTVVSLARQYRVQLPVLTAVAQILEGELSPERAVSEIMNLPQMVDTPLTEQIAESHFNEILCS